MKRSKPSDYILVFAMDKREVLLLFVGFLHISYLDDQIFGKKRNTLQRNGITK